MTLFTCQRRHVPTLVAAAGSLVLAALAIVPAGSATAAGNCAVTYTAKTWGGGFNSSITIKNLGDALNGWTFGFTFRIAGQTVSEGWSATFTQTGTAVAAQNVDYNKWLATGASTDISFNGTWIEENPVPATFTLNGVICSARPSLAATPLGINGQLQVCGVNLCNQYNRPIQLRGMSTHGLQWFGRCYNDASLDVLAQDWKADLLRIAMYVQEGGYETNPARFTDQVNELVDKAQARGMYALIDFHILTPGDPHYNLARAKTFFASVAARNSAKKNVIYEIANEPNGVSWASIKSYADQVIPVIRAADPDAVVIVGNRGWSSLGVSEGYTEAEIIDNPVNATNVMYTFHFYALFHKDFHRAAVARAATKLPLFVTEFGTVLYTGDGEVDVVSSTAWLDLLDQLKISYANWTYSDDDESAAAFKGGTCAATKYDGYAGTEPLGQSGALVRGRIITPDNFPTS